MIFTVIIYGFMRNGLGFLKLFVPSGLPGVIAPFIILIEILSFLSRPVSLSLRLFGNMLAGHIVLKVFAGFRGLAVRGMERCWLVRGAVPVCHDHRTDSSGVPGGSLAGLRVHDPDLRLS